MSRKALEMNSLSLSVYRLREGNLEGGSLPKTCNGRLWRQSIYFTGLHKENLRHLAREGSANTLIGSRPALDIFFCHV